MRLRRGRAGRSKPIGFGEKANMVHERGCGIDACNAVGLIGLLVIFGGTYGADTIAVFVKNKLAHIHSGAKVRKGSGSAVGFGFDRPALGQHKVDRESGGGACGGESDFYRLTGICVPAENGNRRCGRSCRDGGAGVPSADAGCFWHATKEKTVTIAIENAAIAASTFAERRTIEWLCCVIVVHPF